MRMTILICDLFITISALFNSRGDIARDDHRSAYANGIIFGVGMMRIGLRLGCGLDPDETLLRILTVLSLIQAGLISMQLVRAVSLLHRRLFGHAGAHSRTGSKSKRWGRTVGGEASSRPGLAGSRGD